MDHHRREGFACTQSLLVDGLISAMLSARFSELAQKPDAPFLGAFVGRGDFVGHTKEAASLIALVKDGDIER